MFTADKEGKTLLKEIKKISSLFYKVPILSILDDRLLNSDGSVTIGFEVQLQSMEGIDDNFIGHEVEMLAKAMQSMPVINQDIFFQVVFFNTLGADNLHHRRMSHPNIDKFILYKYSCNYDYELFIKNSFERRCVYLFTVMLSSGASRNMRNTSFIKSCIAARDSVAQSVIDNFSSFMNISGFHIRRLDGKEIYQIARQAGSLDSNKNVVDTAECLYPVRRGLFDSDVKEIDTVDVFYMQNSDVNFAVMVMSMLPSYPAYISHVLYQIDFPFIYTLNIMLSAQDKISSELSKQRWFANMFRHGSGEASAINAAKVKAIDEIFKEMSTAVEKWHLSKIYMSFLISDKNIDSLKQKISKMRAIWSTYGRGGVFYTEWIKKIDAYVASIPGCAAKSFDMETTLMPIATSQVPLRGEFRGSYMEYPLSVFCNRYNGLVSINPFSEKQSRWSAMIIGPSGQGKSFLINRFIFDLQVESPFIQILDMATEPSYETITSILGGNYYPVSIDERFRVNIFDLAVGNNAPLGMKMNYLLTGLLRMQTGGNLELADGSVRSLNNRAIQILYDTYMRDDVKRFGSVYVPDHLLDFVLSDIPKGTRYDFWLEYRDFYIRKYLEHPDNKLFLRKAEVCQNIATPTLEDFVRILHHPSVSISEYDRQVAMKINREMDMYVVGGISIMFNGITLLDLNTDSDMYTFFLGRITDPNILSVLLVCYRDFFMRKAVFLTGETSDVMNKLPSQLLNLRQRKKLVLYDEFHNIKRDPYVLQMIDKEMRQSRTFGVAVYLSTQEIFDVLYDETAIVSSCSNKIFLRTYSKEEPTMKHIEDISSRMGFSDAEVAMLKSLEFKKGHYADAMVLQQDIGRGVIRYIPNSFIRWIATTDVDERALRDTITNILINKNEKAKTGDIVEIQKIIAKVVNALAKIMPSPQDTKVKKIDIDEIIKFCEKEN